jgi:hypothetical protein
MLLTIAAAVWALGSILSGIAYAILSSPDSVSTTTNLVIAGQWLAFGAGFLLLCATKLVVWKLFTTRQWSSMWESGGLALSTLLIAIGLLVTALNKTDPSDGASIVSAIGVGGWAIVLLVRAAQRALLEQESPQLPRQAALRLGGAGAIVLFAISVGLPEPSSDDATLAIATAIIGTVGFAALAVVLLMARSRQLFTSRSFPIVVAGLWAFVVSGVARAVSSGFVYGPPPRSLLSLRIGVPISQFTYALALLVLGWAAFGRLAELELTASSPPVETAATMPADPTAAPTEASESLASTQPAWHPDPSGRHEARWWDGVRWTEHVQDQGRPSVDPPR